MQERLQQERPQPPHLGIECQGLVEGHHRLVVATQRLQALRQVAVDLRVFAPKSGAVAEELVRVVPIAPFHQQDAEIVHGAGMPGRMPQRAAIGRDRGLDVAAVARHHRQTDMGLDMRGRALQNRVVELAGGLPLAQIALDVGQVDGGGKHPRFGPPGPTVALGRFRPAVHYDQGVPQHVVESRVVRCLGQPLLRHRDRALDVFHPKQRVRQVAMDRRYPGSLRERALQVEGGSLGTLEV